MQFGHAALINGGTCLQMKPGPVVPGNGDQCAQWDHLTNITINGGGTIDGNGNSGWYNKPYEDDRPVLLGKIEEQKKVCIAQPHPPPSPGLPNRPVLD